MDTVSEQFILEYEVRDSIFFLSMILCVLCVKCGRVFHSLSKHYSLFCLLFSVRFGVCFFAMYNKGMLFAFVNEHSSPVKHNSFINTLFLTEMGDNLWLCASISQVQYYYNCRCIILLLLRYCVLVRHCVIVMLWLLRKCVSKFILVSRHCVIVMLWLLRKCVSKFILVLLV